MFTIDEFIIHCLKSISKFMTFRIKWRFFRLQAKPQFDLHANPGPFSCLSVTCSCLTRYCKTFPTCKNTKPRKAIMMVELSYK